jgi:hypothetical protein
MLCCPRKIVETIQPQVVIEISGSGNWALQVVHKLLLASFQLESITEACIEP